MASLHFFMIRMNYVDRSSPFSNRTRRRRFSSTISSISNHFVDQNNNELLLPIINPSRKRRKLSACIYKPITTANEETNDATEQSPQLAVHLFEGCPVTLRSEQTIPVSTERFLAFGRLYCQDNTVTSMAYYIPRMVPVSIVSTSYPYYDAVSDAETTIYCTKIEFRRRYLPVATQTVENEQQKEDQEQQPSFVSYACWNVSEY
uniref:Uncharacterized protein n=1 Tax=Anopheles culicifacies TaxID=139723 RepID=A0A182MIC1_9DIPT